MGIWSLLTVPVQQLVLAILAYRSLPIILQIALVVCPTLVLLAYLWLLVRQPKVGLILLPVGLLVGAYLIYLYPRANPKPQECVISGKYEASAKWTGLSGWERYWMEYHVPKEWRPADAIIRVRVCERDLYIVMKQGWVYVKGEGIKAKAIEPLTGR